MVSLKFVSLPQYSWPGGTIDGELELDVDSPARSRDLTVSLKGQEITQTTIQAGKSSQTIRQSVDLLTISVDLHDTLQYVDPGHVAPGTYRHPFRMALPADASPSFSSDDFDYRPPTWWNARENGAYVEYLLEARFVVPLWVDTVCRTLVPVFSTRRVLGAVPPMASPAMPDHPSFSIVPDPTALLPGSPFQGSYAVQNPSGKGLRRLVLSLSRVFGYVVNGVQRSGAFPELSTEIPLDGREPSYQGRFLLPLGNNASMTGPWTGALYRSYWVAKAVLELAFGFGITVEAPLNPA